MDAGVDVPGRAGPAAGERAVSCRILAVDHAVAKGRSA